MVQSNDLIQLKRPPGISLTSLSSFSIFAFPLPLYEGRIFVNAAFSFAGTEIIGVALSEVQNPRKNVPKAIARVFWRILLFYVLAIFVVGLIVPYNDPRLLTESSDASASPFGESKSFQTGKRAKRRG